MITQKQAIKAIRATGASVKIIDGEYQVKPPGGSPMSVYYTDDAEDAVGTARQIMIRYKELHHKKMGLFGA